MELSTILIIVAVYIVFTIIKSRSTDSTATMSHGKVVNVDNEVIFKALTSSGLVVIDFYATWCGPCKAVAPKVGEFSDKYENVRFIQVDVDKLGSVAQQLGVTAMPTFVFFKNGQEFGQRVRGANLKALEEGIKGLSA